MQYPFVELLTGVLFSVVILYKGYQGDWGSLLYYLFIISSFTVIFFADLKYGIIPDAIIFPAIVLTFLYHLLFTNYQLPITNYLFSAIGAFIFFLAIYFGALFFFKREGMGFGDVKFAFLLGLIFGFPKTIAVFYIAFLTGALISIILLLLGRKKAKEAVVFGPFLVAASFATLFFGDLLIQKLWFLLGVLP